MSEHVSTPTSAYDLLEPFERQAVDTYVEFIIGEQYRKRHPIRHALSLPIPSEHVRRSKGVLAKPLARAALAQKLTEAANTEDMCPDRVLKEYGVIAFSNMADYVDVREFGDFTVKQLDKIPRELLAAVKSMKTIPSPYGIRTEITLYDKHPALKALAEYMGVVTPDSTPILKEYVKPPVTVEQLQQVPEKAYAELLEQSVKR